MLQLRPAGLAPRFCAFSLDLLIRLSLLYAVLIAAAVMGGIGVAIWFTLIFALEWLYPVIFELTQSGATPGKRAMGLKVVMDSGLPITPAASLTRNLLRAADFLPLIRDPRRIPAAAGVPRRIRRRRTACTRDVDRAA